MFEGLKYAIDARKVVESAMTVGQVVMFARPMCATDVTRDLAGAMTAGQVVMSEAQKFATDATRADLDEFEKGCFYLKVEAHFFAGIVFLYNFKCIFLYLGKIFGAN